MQKGLDIYANEGGSKGRLKVLKIRSINVAFKYVQYKYISAYH